MANVYKNQGFALGTTDLTSIYTVPTGRTTIIKSIQITNEHSSNNLVEISITDASASATYEIYHSTMAAGTTENGALSAIIMESGDILKIQVGVVDKIEGIISYLEIFDEKSS
jgi:hypothetical protein